MENVIDHSTPNHFDSPPPSSLRGAAEDSAVGRAGSEVASYAIAIALPMVALASLATCVLSFAGVATGTDALRLGTQVAVAFGTALGIGVSGVTAISTLRED